MREGLRMKWWVGVVVGLGCFSVTAAPPPESREIQVAANLASRLIELDGKVVRVSFNRISYIQKSKDGLYAGELRSQSKPQLSGTMNYFSDDPGIKVQFPVEGFGLLSKFISEVGAGQNSVTSLGNADSGDVYVLIKKPVSVALGDRYKDGEYEWSKKTTLPDLTDAKKISVTDLLLFPEQVNGKTLQLEFYYADELNKGAGTCTVDLCSSMGGHSPVTVEFPLEGMEFFEEAVNQDIKVLKARTVLVKIDVSSSGKVTVKALGKRQQGKGDEATYKW